MDAGTEAPDEAFLEAAREAYRPDALLPLERARLRSRVRVRLADPTDAGRSGMRTWGLLPGIIVLSAAVLVMAFLLPPRSRDRIPPAPFTTDELASAALLLSPGDVLPAAASEEESFLPPDYRALADLLGEP